MSIAQPLKWHGGKSYLAAHLHRLAPPSVNVDPVNGYTHRNIAFSGGLGELWGWEHEGISEAVNDLNRELTNFWRILQHEERFAEFVRMVEAVPFSQVEWNAAGVPAYDLTDCYPVESAVNFFIRFRQSRQGLGKDFATPTRRTRRGMNENVSAWLSAVEGLPEAHSRLKRVEIRNMPAVEFIRKYDHPRALFYCDPPYLHETREANSTGAYQHEMNQADHSELLRTLSEIEGRFMLSGYDSPLYGMAAASNGWRCERIEIDNKASGKRSKEKKVECVWMNY